MFPILGHSISLSESEGQDLDNNVDEDSSDHSIIPPDFDNGKDDSK